MEAPHNVIWLLINVAEASDRLRDAQCQLKEQDFSWQRLDAVTPKSDDFVYEKSKTKWYRDLTDGEIACYLSHRKAWRQAIDSKADYLVVLEDDLIVQSPLKKVVDELIKSDLSWDMIKLFETRKKRSVVRSLSHDFDIVDTPTVPIATTGYIIKVSCLAKLLDSTSRFTRPIDVELKSYWELNLKIFSVYPPPIRISEDNNSTIGVRQGDFSPFQRLKKIKYNFFSSLRGRLGYLCRRMKRL